MRYGLNSNKQTKFFKKSQYTDKQNEMIRDNTKPYEN